MTNLTLDLKTLESEINAYQQQAGEAIFEIGRRLKHVKENDLAHGEWTSWLSTIDMKPRQAQRFIQVFDELGTKATTLTHFSFTKLLTLSQIAGDGVDIEEIISKPQTLPNGETKMFEEMTSRESEQLKKQLRQSEDNRRYAEEKARRIQRQLDEYQDAYGPIKPESDRVRATNKDELTTSVIALNKTIRDMIKRYGFMKHYSGTIGQLDGVTQQEYRDSIRALKEFAAEFKDVQAGDIIDAEFTA